MSSMNVTSLSGTLLVIQKQLTRSVFSTYLVFGVTGGCLNIILFSRQQFRTISCSIYFLVAAVLMVFNLSLGAGSFLYTLDHDNPIVTIVAFCKCRYYLLQSSAMAYRWCLVVACVDRFAMSSRNARLRSFPQVKMACRIVPAIVVLSFTTSAYMLVFFDIKAGTCGIVYVMSASIYHGVFTIVIGSVLPVVIMIICALLIHHNLVLKRQRRQQNMTEQVTRRKEHQRQRKRDAQVLLMLLAQAVIFVILTTPLLIFNFYTYVTIFVINKTPDRLAIERFSGFLTEMTMLLFPTCSFYLYTLVSRTFRDELVKVLGLIPVCNRLLNTHRIEPLSTYGHGGMTLRTVSVLRTATVLPSPARNALEESVETA